MYYDVYFLFWSSKEKKEKEVVKQSVIVYHKFSFFISFILPKIP